MKLRLISISTLLFFALTTVAFAAAGPSSSQGGFTGTELLVVVGLPILIFCGIYFGVTHSYHSEGKDHSYPFRERASHKLTKNHDQFVREYTTSVRIQRQGGGPGGRGGPGGGRGGRR